MTGTLYAARSCGNKYQTVFPDRCVIDFNEPDENVRRAQVEAAVKNDHDPANFGDKGRSNKNFVCADMCTIDIDNADPDPAKWASVDDILRAFTTDEGEGPAGFITRSRHYMQEAHGNVAERFHVYLLIDMTIDGPHLTALRLGCNQVLDVFTVDPDALDPSRMTYGTEEPCVVFLPGRLTLDAFMRKKGIDVDALNGDGSEHGRRGERQFNVQDRTDEGRIVYHEGTRNVSVCRDFSRYLKRRGTADPAATQQAFEEIAARCSPPLDNAELNDIYNSCLRLYENDIKNRADYTSPEEYDQKMAEKDFSQDQGPDDQQAPDQTQEEKIQALGELLVADRSDVGQGEAFATLYHNRILYFEGDWLYYTGTVWESNKARVRALEHEHTQRQLNVTTKKILAATKEKLDAEKGSPEEVAAQKKIDAAELDRKWVLGRRKASAIDAAIKSAAPVVQVKAEELDADPELLNTPAGIVDLRSGILTPSDPAARCTRITGVGPGDQGRAMWEEFLGQITDGDETLIKYLQQVSGMFLVGRVMLEKLIAAYSPQGGTGKSTFFNTLQKVMGTYAGGLAADVLTTSGRQNAKAEMAELRGKRLVVCAELSDGCRLNSSMLKQLCSTDLIRAEKKYQDPFSFTPSHSIVLYTNYLPKVSAQDSGTWSRIAIVPFQHTFRGKPGEVLNYSNRLTDEAGPYVLQWMIDGAVEFLRVGGLLSTPAAVQDAVDAYKNENDTVQTFIEDACIVGPDYCKQSNPFYVAYRKYCEDIGARPKSRPDFFHQMHEKGFETRKTKTHNEILGITSKD